MTRNAAQSGVSKTRRRARILSRNYSESGMTSSAAGSKTDSSRNGSERHGKSPNVFGAFERRRLELADRFDLGNYGAGNLRLLTSSSSVVNG